MIKVGFDGPSLRIFMLAYSAGISILIEYK